MFNIDQLCPSLWDVCQTPHASYYRIRYILSNWRKIFQSLWFPGIQIARAALIHPALGQITIANNKTYKKATSRSWIFVCFRGLNDLNIICPRSQELECGLAALQCHRTAGMPLTPSLSLSSASLCVICVLCWSVQCLLGLSVTFLCPSWKGGPYRYEIPYFHFLCCPSQPCLKQHWCHLGYPLTSMHPSSPSSEPLSWTNLIWTGLFILVEETWQRYQFTSSAW